MKTADIYLITNLINGKQYVGQTTKGYLKRWRDHCTYANRINIDRQSHQLIDKVIDKYGISNFKIELLETVSIEQKDETEQFYIQKYDTYNNGYNLTIGGDFNPMFDEKVKQHHKEIMQSTEMRNKMSKSVRNAYTDDLRKWFSNDSKQKWQNATYDQRKLMTKAFINYNNSRKQKIAMLDNNDNILQVFDSCSAACRYCNKPIKEAGHILLVCDKFNKNGKRAKHFGHYWKKL